MKISDLKFLFQNELSELYSKSEIEELFSVFCENYLELNRIELRINLDNDLSEIKSKQFLEAISALKTGKPFQQILGETEFYGMKFFVNEHVLIPRPETEELLELVIETIKDLRLKVEGLKIMDIGTGSGIIPIVLKKYFPETQVSAIDISEDALKIAKKNSEFHKTKINFIQKDYLNERLNEVYDIIISNPPYIGIEENIEIEESVKGFEPNIALFSPTSDDLIFYRKIAKDSENHLSENGMIFLEINQKLGRETLELFQNFSESILLKDISGNDRMIFCEKIIMEIKIHNINNTKIAEVISDKIIIKSIDDGTDLVGNLYYQDLGNVILYEQNISSDFFDLKTKIAGEILQKFSNYRIRLVIVGHFEKYHSKSLRDFVLESNKSRHINFVETFSEALEKLAL